MQESSSALPHWVFQILYGLAWLIGGGGIVKLITIYQNRQRPRVEAQKTEAETTEITIRSHSTAGDSMIRMMDRLDEALNNNDRLRSERDELRMRVDLQVIELQMVYDDIKKLKGFIDAKGLKPSEMDEPKS